MSEWAALSKARSSMTLAEKLQLIKWWDATEVFRGRFELERMLKGLQMARKCTHPDALWLVSLFPDGRELTEESVKEAFAREGEDPRALFFLSGLDYDTGKLKWAAEMGYAPAQAVMQHFTYDLEGKFAWATKAARQGHRSGLYYLGGLLHAGFGCEKDEARGLEYIREAAQLGHVEAQYDYAIRSFSADDWQRYALMGRAADRGYDVATKALTDAAVAQLRAFESGQGAGRVVFEIGRRCKVHQHATHAQLFDWPALRKICPAMRRCVQLYDEWCEAAKRAVNCWSVIGQRLGVVKDIRLMIARMVWEGRSVWGEKRKS